MNTTTRKIGQIISTFLLSLFGAYMGVLLGVVVAILVTAFFFRMFSIDGSGFLIVVVPILLFSIVFAIILGSLFGIITYKSFEGNNRWRKYGLPVLIATVVVYILLTLFFG